MPAAHATSAHVAWVTCVLTVRVYYVQEQLESLILELRDLKAAVTRMEGAQQGEAGQQGPLELGQLGPEQGQGQQDGTGVPEQDEQQQVEEQLQTVATTADGVTGGLRTTFRQVVAMVYR